MVAPVAPGSGRVIWVLRSVRGRVARPAPLPQELHTCPRLRTAPFLTAPVAIGRGPLALQADDREPLPTLGAAHASFFHRLPPAGCSAHAPYLCDAVVSPDVL